MTTDPIAASRARRQFQRAESYLASGHIEAAASAFDAVLAEQPGHLPSLLRLSALRLTAADYASAHALSMRAVQQTMDSPATVIQLLGQLVALGESVMVLEICSQLPPPMWDSAHSLAAVAQQLSRIGAHQQARHYARAAVDRDPRHPPSLYMSAHIEVFFGEIDLASELLERALALHPDLVDAHWLMSRLRRPQAGSRIDRIERALARVAAGEDEAFLAYALHNELHDAGDFERAWAALERACRAKRSQLNYRLSEQQSLFAQLRQWSASELAVARGSEQPGLTPIFVIGMHRSGTTLIERILGGHSRISAAGETYEFPTQLRAASGHYTQSVVDAEIVSARQRLDYARIGTGYLAGMSWRSRGRAFVTDKLPSNFLNVGFIAQALPQARFIHVCRNPIDTGLSNLRTLFTNACPYAYDQREFIEYYGLYQGLMAHWRQLLPERMLDVHYQDVVDDPLAAARRMSDFCGLPLEQDMVEIGRSNDPVATASSVLVRDGIRRDRSKLWSSYADHLQPLIAAFGSHDGR